MSPWDLAGLWDVWGLGLLPKFRVEGEGLRAQFAGRKKESGCFAERSSQPHDSMGGPVWKRHTGREPWKKTSGIKRSPHGSQPLFDDLPVAK